MIIEKTFGETIKKLRKEKNLTLREVAEVMKIDISMLGKIEKNNRKPNKQMIEKFSEFFKVSNKDLMVSFLSDEVAFQVLDEEEFAYEVLRVAERKVEYWKQKPLKHETNK